MTDKTKEPAAPRMGMQPENVAVLVVGALVVGLLVGQGIGRRQGLEVKRVVLPADASAMAHAGPAAPGDDAAETAAMKASAPKPPKSLDEARAMVAKMGDAPPDELLSLGDRKFGNGVHYLAAAFYEKALTAQPNHPQAWLRLGRCYDAVGERAKARGAYQQALATGPDPATAAEARHALGG